MRGLVIVVTEPVPARLRAALTMALAAQALGGTARLFLEAEAVSLLAQPSLAGDAPREAAGLPTARQLLDEAFDAGIRVTLCQSGLALSGLHADALDPRFDYGGMTGLLAGLNDDRLVLA